MYPMQRRHKGCCDAEKTHLEPELLLGQLERPGLHNSGWDVVEIDQLKRQLTLAPGDVQHA